jgi:hypothetical protein
LRPAQTHDDVGESPFALVEPPRAPELESEGPVRYLLTWGRQDDGLWGPVGAFWLSRDERRGGFLVHPWGIELGSELARSFRSALGRGFTPMSIFDYWANEVWTGTNVRIDEERYAGTLLLVNELVAVL